MPNFVCQSLSRFKFPIEIGDCKFLWQMWELKKGQKTKNSLVFVKYLDDNFLLSVRYKEDMCVVKGDKVTKPTNIAHLHAALNAIKINYAKNLISDTVNRKEPVKLQYVLEPERLAKVLNGEENDIGFDFPQIFGIWNLEYFDEMRLEIGFGSAAHLLYRAEREPNVLFVGLEIYRAGIAKASRVASDLGLKNVLFTQADARQICELFKDDLFDLIYMHFPIPWNDSPTRRALNANFVLELNRILKQDGKFQLRSDDFTFLTDSAKLFLKMPNADIRIVKDRQIEIMSKYESRWREQNKDIYDLTYTCDKKIDLLHKCNTCDFEFSGIDEECIGKIKSMFKNASFKYDGFFIHYECLYEDLGDTCLLLKASYGDFFAPCSVYVLITQNDAKYIIKPPSTTANAKAHEKLQEYITTCEIL